MQVFRIEITPRHRANNDRIVQSAHQLNITGITACYAARLFFVAGDVSLDEAVGLASALLADPVTENYTIGVTAKPADLHLVETTFYPGVTDPAAESLMRSADFVGVDGMTRCATGMRYEIAGDLTHDELTRLANEILSNPVIQRCVIDQPIDAPFVPYDAADDTVELVPVRGLDDTALMQISLERRLSLDVNEMRAIRDYFDGIERDPTDAELEMLAQTWSEHCVHKTFKANILYKGPAHGAAPDTAPTEQQINGLLKTYIRAATEQLNKAWVRSAFVDNAGIVRFDDHWDLAFKVETHNRPSAIEPFGGANTGSGGVIRDVIGVSARPIANTDILCFGLPDTPREELPQGVLHPRRIADGVVAGIEDYGNKMGIPTVNGAIYYHKGYTSNPLVFCGSLGILPHGAHRSEPQPGDFIVVIGGHTGRDGLRGATFSSMEMDTSTAKVSGGAVQIGHAIHEKQVLEVVMRARDERLYNAITDCGAGGLSSAVGEMGAQIGATVQLERVPLKYPGLRPWEIWLSEAQERMVLAVPRDQWARFKQICDGQDVTAVIIGVFEPTGHLTLTYNEKVVGNISMDFLHDGIPTRHMSAMWLPPLDEKSGIREVTPGTRENFSATLLKLLGMPTIRSKEDVIRRYDHEVQTGTAVKPLVGAAMAGPSDAAVLLPLDTINEQAVRAVAISNAISPSYGEIDPYAMALLSVDEAMRNLVAVGANPDEVAILDNFSWGNTNMPDRLGALVRCSQGCYDAALAYEAPFISGKDSLNNEYLGADGQRHAIPGTLVISAIGMVPDVRKTRTMDLKRAGNQLFLIGVNQDEMGGSHYNILHGVQGGKIALPAPDALNWLRSLYDAINAGHIQSCHDVSEGGVAVALAEMCLAGHLGADVDLARVVDFDAVAYDPENVDAMTLFGEAPTRFIVEVMPEDADALLAVFAGRLGMDAAASIVRPIGVVTDTGRLTVETTQGKRIDAAVSDLENAWRGHIEDSAPVTMPPTQAVNVSRPARTSKQTGLPRVMILHANGTNRDRDAALACELAGGEPEIVHVNQLISGERRLLDYHMMVIAGGFSYGDDLGAGVLWALDLRERIHDVDTFVAEGRPVLGICNGFQTLVKSGLLPGKHWQSAGRSVTLTYNERNQFECRWVYMKPNPSSVCLFTDGLDELIHCPVAHGEGRVAAIDDETARRLFTDGLVPLTYVDELGIERGYPINPNGSAYNIAGLCNPEGNVFGLMPHPENHIFPWQNPRSHRGGTGMMGLKLFENGIKRS